MRLVLTILIILGAIMFINRNESEYVFKDIDCRQVRDSALCGSRMGQYVSILKDRKDGNLDQTLTCDCKTGKLVDLND